MEILFKRKAGGLVGLSQIFNIMNRMKFLKAEFLAKNHSVSIDISGIREPGLDIYYCCMVTGDNFNV